MRLSYNQKSFILAKDSKKNRIKLGGLGALGVGVMWVSIEPGDENKPGFKDAPEEKSFILHEDCR